MFNKYVQDNVQTADGDPARLNEAFPNLLDSYCESLIQGKSFEQRMLKHYAEQGESIKE